jgi:hypothetical protein
MELLIRRIEKKICVLWDRDSKGAEGIGSGAIVSASYSAARWRSTPHRIQQWRDTVEADRRKLFYD